MNITTCFTNLKIIRKYLTNKLKWTRNEYKNIAVMIVMYRPYLLKDYYIVANQCIMPTSHYTLYCCNSENHYHSMIFHSMLTFVKIVYFVAKSISYTHVYRDYRITINGVFVCIISLSSLKRHRTYGNWYLTYMFLCNIQTPPVSSWGLCKITSLIAHQSRHFRHTREKHQMIASKWIHGLN